jgi:hypothetical protein
VFSSPDSERQPLGYIGVIDNLILVTTKIFDSVTLPFQSLDALRF